MKNDLISRQAVTKFLNDWLSCLFENCHKQSASDLKMIIKDFKNLPSVQPERKDALEKAVAVEAISDELMSRFDISATYAYDVAESAVNRIEVMAKKMYRGEDG